MSDPNTPEELFLHARTAAAQGRFAELEQIGLQLQQAWAGQAAPLLQLGIVWKQSGFLNHAQDCFDQGCTLSPHNLTAMANLASLASDRGQHDLSRQLYQELLALAPDNLNIRRNALLSMEYDLNASPAERLQAARNWGQRAMAAAQSHPLPRRASRAPGKLRIGYVSADFCQHTVGLLVKDVLAHHNSDQFEVYAYSAGHVRDWVTEQIRKCCAWRDVSRLSDAELALQIYQDQIDVLVDLSGHTAGSRLAAFAYRPAPVQLSWLGYFASTGLDCIDAVLLDEWHAPPGTKAQFVEKIIRLPCGRLPYQPVPWAPEPSPPPVLQKGYITFGSFNNTSKLNEQVLTVWADILLAVPNSRLLLKWRTFNDKAFCASIHQRFAQAGVSPKRIELRNPSFHNQLLHEYSDMDIALDPFPFTGGLTSFEALWMGVPVITWPQDHVVSRQTFAQLSAMHQPNWTASSDSDYVNRAIELAQSPQRLAQARLQLRHDMQGCLFMQAKSYARHLEKIYLQVHSQKDAPKP
jgi:protein O-GlcNAc transferase